MNKKNLFTSFMLLFALLLCACGSTAGENGTSTSASAEESAVSAPSSETSAAPESTAAEAISMYDLNKAMCGADRSLPEMSLISSSDAAASDLFAYFSKLDYRKVESYFLSYAAKGTAEEIGVIALKDERDADECKRSLEDHVKDRVNLYKTYAPDQVQRAEKAAILAEGRYVALIMCDEQKAVTEAFLSFLEGK